MYENKCLKDMQRSRDGRYCIKTEMNPQDVLMYCNVLLLLYPDEL